LNPFEGLSSDIQHLVTSIASAEMYGPITTYTPFIIFILLLVVVIVFTAKSQLSLVPKNRFVGTVEFFVNFTQTQLGYGVLGPAAKKHIPFLLTMFIFILVSNLIGIIPGSKAATGTIGTTIALTVVSFVYFTYYGIKTHGLGHYILSYKPKGVAGPLAWSIWVLEFLSMLLRLLTLSIRLFGNLFAGHLLLGVLALLTTAFITPLIVSFSLASIPFGLVGVLWFILLIAIYALELFVACVQAFIFTLLTSVYVYLSTGEH
jgi:F-type H+-transporting ATPase subunit a